MFVVVLLAAVSLLALDLSAAAAFCCGFGAFVPPAAADAGALDSSTFVLVVFPAGAPVLGAEVLSLLPAPADGLAPYA